MGPYVTSYSQPDLSYYDTGSSSDDIGDLSFQQQQQQQEEVKTAGVNSLQNKSYSVPNQLDFVPGDKTSESGRKKKWSLQKLNLIRMITTPLKAARLAGIASLKRWKNYYDLTADPGSSCSSSIVLLNSTCKSAESFIFSSNGDIPDNYYVSSGPSFRMLDFE